MANPMLESACDTLESKLHEKGFSHLRVRFHGKHLVIYSEYDGHKENRARFTQLKQQFYQLGVADHRGKWESTPFTGSLSELVTMLTEQFPFALVEF